MRTDGSSSVESAIPKMIQRFIRISSLILLAIWSGGLPACIVCSSCSSSRAFAIQICCIAVATLDVTISSGRQSLMELTSLELTV